MWVISSGPTGKVGCIEFVSPGSSSTSNTAASGTSSSVASSIRLARSTTTSTARAVTLGRRSAVTTEIEVDGDGAGQVQHDRLDPSGHRRQEQPELSDGIDATAAAVQMSEVERHRRRSDQTRNPLQHETRHLGDGSNGRAPMTVARPAGTSRPNVPSPVAGSNMAMA